MVNPLLTVLFDLFLVGAAIAIIAAMVDEYFSSRTPAIGRRSRQATPQARVAARPDQRRAGLKKVA